MKTAEKEKLWKSYQKDPSPELREQIILEYAPLVKVVAGRLSMYLGYNVEYDDLVGYGIFGLIDAIDKYDAGKDVKFETYASLRIRLQSSNIPFASDPEDGLDTQNRPAKAEEIGRSSQTGRDENRKKCQR